MGCVNDRGDALRREEGREPLRSAEAADALRNRRARGMGGRAGERKQRRDARLVRDPAREGARFRRAAQDEKTKAQDRLRMRAANDGR
jgi:hypothetical protein